MTEKEQKPVIVVHGGAGTWHPERSNSGLEGVKKAAKTGFDILKGDGSAVDAVMEAVAVMENSDAFNAGYGSSLNIEKRVEMESSIMDGKNTGGWSRWTFERYQKSDSFGEDCHGENGSCFNCWRRCRKAC